MNNGSLESLNSRISLYKENAKQMRRATDQMNGYVRRSAFDRAQMQQKVEQMMAALEATRARV